MPDAAELEFLAGLAGLHQQIIDEINNWQVQKASAALLSVDPAEHLAWLQKERKRTEDELALEKVIKAEQIAAFNARVKLLKFKQRKS